MTTTTQPQKSWMKERKLTLWSTLSSEIIWTGLKWRKINQWICLFENIECQSVFFLVVYKFCVLTSMLSVRLKQTDNIEVKTQNLLHRKQTNLGPLRKLCYFMIVYFDPKFTACFCMFWSLTSVTRNSFLPSLVKFFWGFKVDQMSKYNTSSAF